MGLPPERKKYKLLIYDIEFKQPSMLLEETMQKERFGHHARHLTVEVKVKAWINKRNPIFCLELKEKFASFSPSGCPHYHSDQ